MLPDGLTTRLRFETTEPGIYKVEIFDLLGRSSEIWRGSVVHEQELMFDGQAYASGIYFARVSNSIYNRPVAMTKIVLIR
jgi:hypothetical protein